MLVFCSYSPDRPAMKAAVPGDDEDPQDCPDKIQTFNHETDFLCLSIIKISNMELHMKAPLS